MRNIAIIICVLAVLGCAKKTKNGSAQPQQIGGLIALPGNHLVGPPPRPQTWPGISCSTPKDHHTAPIGSHVILVAVVKDDYGVLVSGAQVMFTANKTVLGLGTFPTDANGEVRVQAGPYYTGTTTITAQARTAHALAPSITFTLIGR